MQAPEEMPHPAPTAHRRWVIPVTAAGYAFFVAAGVRVMAVFAESMMSGVGLIGSWLLLVAGLAYAGLRLRPAIGGAMFAGVTAGALVAAFFGGVQMMS